MSNYFDNSHIDGKQLTPQQIADAIRHKKFGVDVREAIAQGFEQFIGLLGRVRNLESEYSDLQGDVKALTEKHNDDIDATNQRLTKLEKAVFDAQYINDTDDVADHDKSVVSQDINDTNAIDDDDGLIIEQDNYKSLPSDIN